MTDSTSSIQGAGKGYFNADGALKTKSELAKSEESSPEKSAEAAVVDESFGKKTDNAFQKVEGRFLEKANQALTISSETENQLKEVRKVINKEINAAKELKTAIKDSDSEAEEAARKKLTLAQEERKVVEEKVENFNREKASERRVTLNLGNAERGKVEVNEIKLTSEKPVEDSDIDKAKEVQKYIDSLKEERSSINSQLQDVRQIQEEVGSTVNRVKADLNSLERNTIASYEEAAKTADKIANSIRQGGQELVQSTISSKITPEMIAKFLG